MNQVTCRHLGVVMGLLFSASSVVMAEDITLTTYYPAPRGVYEEIRTTNNTYLASLAGSVGIGTATVPGGGKFVVAGIGQNPVGGVCPTGTNWYDDNGNGTPDNGECKPTGLYVVAASGNVGIGTTTPTQAKLVVNQSSGQGSAIRFGDLGALVSSDTVISSNEYWNGSVWTIINPAFGTAWVDVGQPSATPAIIFATGPANTVSTERMRIDNAGNVGIGKVPGVKLDVAGVIHSDTEVNACGGGSCSHLRWTGNNSNYLRGNTYFNGVLYDENNTAYYLQPSATSVFNGMYASGNLDANDVNIRAFPGGARAASSLQPNITGTTYGTIFGDCNIVVDAFAGITLVNAPGAAPQGSVYCSQAWGQDTGPGPLFPSSSAVSAFCDGSDVALSVSCFDDNNWGGCPRVTDTRRVGATGGYCRLHNDCRLSGGFTTMAQVWCLRK